MTVQQAKRESKARLDIQDAVLRYAIKGEGGKFSDALDKALTELYCGGQIDLIRENNANALDEIQKLETAKPTQYIWESDGQHTKVYEKDSKNKVENLEWIPQNGANKKPETLEDLQVKAMDLLQSGRINLFECLSVSQAPDLATAKVAFNSIKPRK